MLRQKRTSKLVFVVFRCFRLRRYVSRTVVGRWVSMSEVTMKALRQPSELDPVHINPLDTERVTALRTNGWLPSFHFRSVDNEGLKAGLGTPFESAPVASLHVAHDAIACILPKARAIVKIRQDMAFAIDMRAFIAFDL